jgi:hypothetical protein
LTQNEFFNTLLGEQASYGNPVKKSCQKKFEHFPEILSNFRWPDVSRQKLAFERRGG